MSTHKRKRHVVVSSDEEFIQNDNNDSELNAKKKSSKKERKIKKLVSIDSDEDDANDEISINDIKKNAAKRAKKLAQGIDEEPAKKTKTNKTPPSANQSILNYFKPRNSNKEETKTNEKQLQKSEKKSTDDHAVSDEFTYTYVKPKSKYEDESKTNDDKTKKKVEDKVLKVEPKTEKTNLEKPSVKPSIKEKTISSPIKAAIKSPLKSKQAEKSIQKENKKAVIVSKNSSPKKPFVPSDCLPRLIETKKESDLWVDKYRPKNSKSVIGQQGDQSSLNKLTRWLRNWHKNIDKKPAFGKWGSDDGSGYRAALLSGPPGIGKTTTAQIICNELGYDYLELNASDTRSKKLINGQVRELLGNTKLTDFFKSNESNSKTDTLTSKHCVIMDEVDGMAGNEDRGGISELIQLIKNTRIPIICICNNRNDKKMRSLVNYCFDLKFHKPSLQAIKGLLMSIVYKEKIKVDQNILNDLIASTNFDIRQCIHNLSLLSAGCSISTTKDNQTKDKPIKDIKLGPFEAIKKVFATGEEYSRMSFLDKSDLFFVDYGIMPLFVYENYIQVDMSSKCSSVAKQWKRLAQSIDSMSIGDIIEKEVRTNQNWSLLPLQAAFSTVMPGSFIRSNKGLGFPSFPQYMGKLSTYNKNCRIVDELNSHMVLSAHGTRMSLALDYLEPLKDQLIAPLIHSEKGGVPVVLDVMEKYSLVKDDMDSIIELSMWNNDTNPLKNLDSKTKSSLTRAYNKKDFALPYAVGNDTRVISKKGKSVKGKKSAKMENDDEEMEDDFTEEEPEIMMDIY